MGQLVNDVTIHDPRFVWFVKDRHTLSKDLSIYPFYELHHHSLHFLFLLSPSILLSPNPSPIKIHGTLPEYLFDCDLLFGLSPLPRQRNRYDPIFTRSDPSSFSFLGLCFRILAKSSSDPFRTSDRIRLSDPTHPLTTLYTHE